MVVLKYSPITYLCTLHSEGLARTSAALKATAEKKFLMLSCAVLFTLKTHQNRVKWKENIVLCHDSWAS